MRRRSVLQLFGSFHQGGTERQAVQLTRLLCESGRYQVHVACLDVSGVLRADVERLNVGHIEAFPLTSFYNRNAARQLLRFARFLRERKISIVQTHDFYTNVFGIAGARLAGVPVRIAARRETSGVRTPAQKWAELRAYALAHMIVANAEAVREALIQEGVRPDKTTVIYNGLDMRRVAVSTTSSSASHGDELKANELQPDEKVGVEVASTRKELDETRREEALAMLNLTGEGKRRFVTIVANLRSVVKDHAMFLRAAQRVRGMVPEATFVLAGEGELTDSLREMAAQLGLGKDVLFTGRCERVAELLSVSDVCVLSSRAEGFSNAILEYMAAARPVVATDVGGAREAIVEGETGYLVPAGDDEAFATRIIELLREPKRARIMGERGRRIVEAKFSPAAQLERTEELYERLLTATKRRAPYGNFEKVTRPTSRASEASVKDKLQSN